MSEYTCDMSAIKKMYRKMYWRMIFDLHNTFGVKWIAIKSLWIMRKMGGAK